MHIKTITFSGETKAIIRCEQKLQNISVYIFDKPVLEFNEHCNFNTIEIFDSPIIILPKNRQINVEKLILSNSSYENLFHFNKIISISNHKQIQRNNVFLCKSNYEFDLLDDVHIKCSNSFEFSINYADFQDFQFINYNNNPVFLKNISIDNNFDYYLLNNIFKSLVFYEKEKIIFINFANITLLEPHIENFKSENSLLLTTFNWPEIMSYNICLWVDGMYFDKNMKTFFDNMETQTSWRKICLNNTGYFYYQNNQLKGYMVITTATFFGIIALIIVVVLLVILSLYCIAYKLHYNNLNKSINEDDLSDTTINSNDE